MLEPMADSVAQELDSVLTEHTVRRDEFGALTDAVVELVALTRSLNDQVEKLGDQVEKLGGQVERLGGQVEKLGDRIYSLEKDVIPALELRMITAIKEGDHNNLKWQIGSMLAFLSVVAGAFGTYFYYITLAFPG